MFRSRRKAIVIVAIVLALPLLLGRFLMRPAPLEGAPPQPVAGVETSLARVEVADAGDALEIVVGPVTIPAGNAGLRTPIQLVELPAGGTLHGFEWRITDAAGRPLPAELLHHVNLLDPDRRDLFSHTARKIAAAGRESGAQRFTPLIGYPLAAGTRLLVVAMFSNPGPEDVESAWLRLRLLVAPERRVLKALPVFPFSLDVMGPVGEKSFPVPPGRTERSWEGSPAVDARVLAIGGHLHDHGTELRLEDAASGEVLWAARPQVEGGRLLSVPTDMPWKRGGIRLRADRRYRVTVVYDNPTQQPAEHGGMGVIAGVAHVGRAWPPLDPDDADYRTDLERVIRAPHEAAGHGAHGTHGHVH